MIYPLADLQKMKLRPRPSSTQPRIFDNSEYVHPWYEHADNKLIKPNPPTKEAVERAKFVDKTYRWSRGSSN